MKIPARGTKGKNPSAAIVIINWTPTEMPAENPGRQMRNRPK
jgi:hypothetical protein